MRHIPLILCFLAGSLCAAWFMSWNNDKTKPLWVNQEIRERVFLTCVSGLKTNNPDVVNACNNQAKELSTVGNEAGEILFRPRKDVVNEVHN